MRAHHLAGIAASISIGLGSAAAAAQTAQPYPPPPYQQPQQTPYPYYQAPPPGYGQPPQYVPPPSPRIKYQPGMAPPQGYHIEETPRKGLVISGFVVLGTTYFLSATIGASSSNTDDRWLLVPVFGPFIDIGNRNAHGCPTGTSTSSLSCDVFDPIIRTYLAFDGVAQATGALLLTLGYVFPKKEFVADSYYSGKLTGPRMTSWTVVPQVTPGARYGLMLRGEVF
jgi:hypothetical protein